MKNFEGTAWSSACVKIAPSRNTPRCLPPTCGTDCQFSITPSIILPYILACFNCFNPWMYMSTTMLPCLAHPCSFLTNRSQCNWSRICRALQHRLLGLLSCGTESLEFRRELSTPKEEVRRCGADQVGRWSRRPPYCQVCYLLDFELPRCWSPGNTAESSESRRLVPESSVRSSFDMAG